MQFLCHHTPLQILRKNAEKWGEGLRKRNTNSSPLLLRNPRLLFSSWSVPRVFE
jgi:hypothetical protein